MATMDVLAPSNWTSATAYAVLESASLGGCGWDGLHYHSEGRIVLSNTAGAAQGKRISEIVFNYTATNPGYAPWYSVVPKLRVTLTDLSHLVNNANVSGLTSLVLPSYDETTKDIQDIRFSDEGMAWTVYSYGSDGDGGDEGPFCFLDLFSLTLTYPGEDAPPYVWQSYVNTTEITS